MEKCLRIDALIRALRRLRREQGKNLRVALITDCGLEFFYLDYHPQIDVVQTPMEDGTLEDIVAIAQSTIPINEQEPEPPTLKLIKNDPPEKK
jgi:hypothetical protein